jgi:hypothetical protein
MVAQTLKNAEPLNTIYIPGNPSTQCRHRWRMVGVKDKDGNRIKLKCHKIGGRVHTTPEDVDRFIVALSDDAAPVDDRDDMARRGREAGKALEALGC